MWAFTPTKPDLYYGLTGTALFLGHLGAQTGEDWPRELARGALATQRKIIAETPELIPYIGFNGWGGILYTLTHLSALWNDEDLLDEALGLVNQLVPQIEADGHHDVLFGAAGCLLSLLGLYDRSGADRVLETALLCGRSLMASARPMETGVGWMEEAVRSQALTGMSLGTAGIALALLRLAEAAGEASFRATALAALEYERSLYSPEERNWPDLRRWKRFPDDTERFQCGWCHGAPGIGLARVGILPLVDDSLVREEISAAVKTTLAEGFGRSHCLCHGDLGNLDFLLEASRATCDPILGERIPQLAGGVLASIEEHGYRCGLPIDAEPLGLMVGLTGIGYGLLRLAAPEQIPSVLLLEAPRKAAQDSETALVYASLPGVCPGETQYLLAT